MKPNDYSNGIRQALLTREQIRASWGRGDHSGQRILLINEAFRLFYRYRRRIEQVSAKDFRTYWAMLKELEDAGDTGWGLFGVQDLDEAFQHLIANNGTWTDENTTHYWGSNAPSVYPCTVFDAPAAGANFLTALNRKLGRLQELTVKYRTAAQSAEQPEAKLRRLRELGQDMAALAWLLPVPQPAGGAETCTPYEKLIEACEAFNKAVEYLNAAGVELRASLQVIAKVTDWLTKADQAAQAMVAVRRAGLPQNVSYMWSALVAAVSFVPVLGEFYAKALVGAPGLVEWMKTTVWEYERRIQLAEAGRL